MIDALVAKSNGLIICSFLAGMPERPAIPVPLVRFSTTVSSESSKWCAVAILWYCCFWASIFNHWYLNSRAAIWMLTPFSLAKFSVSNLFKKKLTSSWLAIFSTKSWSAVDASPRKLKLQCAMAKVYSVCANKWAITMESTPPLTARITLSVSSNRPFLETNAMKSLYNCSLAI